MLSLFSLFALSSTPPLLCPSLQPSEWSLLREKEEVVLGDGAGCWREVHEQSRIWEEVHYSGLRRCWALPLSPSCLLCLMLRAINIFNWELLLRLSFTSQPYIINQPQPYSVVTDYRTRAATNICFHCWLICRLFSRLIDWLFLF